MFEFLFNRNQVQPFLEAVITASNQERNSLGFLPKAAYSEFAFQERLIVALDAETKAFAGYAIFAGAFPNAKIRQTYVAPKWRRRGLGRQLVSAVIERCERLGFLSVKATVASDLAVANAFYGSLGFAEFARKQGGQSKNRQLIIRARELDTPSLFNLLARPPVLGALSLAAPSAGSIPIYLLDLNVVFDVVEQRSRRKEAERVFGAAFENSVKLAISSEFVEELERHSQKFKNDHLLSLVKSLPNIPKPGKQVARSIYAELAQLIFPSRYKTDTLRPRDVSDLNHLLTAVVEDVAGFVTSEKRILRQAELIRERYSVEIISPAVFASAPELEAPTTSQIIVEDRSRRIAVRSMVEDDRDSLMRFGEQLGLSANQMRSALASGTSHSPRTRYIVFDDDAVLAFASWQVGARDDAASELFVAVDVANESSELAVDHVLDTACRSVSRVHGSAIWMEANSHRPLVIDRAINFGFQRSSDEAGRNRLTKVCWGKPITSTTWQEVSSVLLAKFGLRLSAVAPSFPEEDSTIELVQADSKAVAFKLHSLEDFLAPTLLALNQRPSIIVPIRPSYAEALFQGTKQPKLFAGQRAGLLPQKCYLSDASTIAKIPSHGLIVFYESGGKGQENGRLAATAIGRIRRRYLATQVAAVTLAQLRGVLTLEEIGIRAKGGQVCVTEFDSLLQFRNVVPLARLKEINCADGANLVTARKLGLSALQNLIEIGEPYASANL